MQESQNRIQTIALVHEKLYQSSNLSQIDFQAYVEELVANLFHAYGMEGKIFSEINIAIAALNIDLAIPCSLIISELVSNALKHAFINRKSGNLRIDMHASQTDEITLSIKDDGVGISKKFDIKNTSTLGFQLVQILTRQLQGSIRVLEQEGTHISITFAPSRL